MLTLDRLKLFEKRSEESTAFTADMLWNGQKIGKVKNDGQGPYHEYHFKSHEQDVRDWAKTQETQFPYDKLEQVIEILVDQHIEEAEYR